MTKIEHAIQQARKSDLAMFPFRLVYVDYRLIGTHEALDTKLERTVYDSILANGYSGPPISVFENGSDRIFTSGIENSPLEINYGDVGIADGHHRFKSLTMLGDQGLLRNVFIPVQLIPTHDNEIIRVGTIDQNEEPLSVAEIEACFADPLQSVPICSSHFQTKAADGHWYKLDHIQPDLHIEKDVLLNVDN